MKMQIGRNSRKIRIRLSAAVVTGCAAILASIPVSTHAGTLYWDSDANAVGNSYTSAAVNAGLGGTGNWNSTNVNWWVLAAVSDSAFGATAGTNSAVFAGTAGTVTMSSTLPGAVTGLEFDTDGYLITASTLTLYGSAPVSINTVGSGVTATINSILAVTPTTGTVNKDGAGKLVLGGTTNSTGAGAGSVFNINDGELESAKSITGSAIVALTLNIGDGIGLAGSAKLTITGNSTAAVGAGTVVNLNSDGVWTRNSATDTIAGINKLTGQTISGGQLTFSATGGAAVSGANAITADLAIGQGGIRSRTWTFSSNTDTLSFSNVFSVNTANASSMTFIGPVGSTVTYGGGTTNTYAGSTIVTGSTLLLNKSGSALAISGGAASNGSITINGGGTIQLVGRGEQITDGINNTLTLGGTGGTATTGGTFDLNGYTETVDALPLTMSGGGVIKSTVANGLIIFNTTAIGSASGGSTTATGTGNVISANMQLTTLASRGVGTTDPFRRFTVTTAVTDTLLISGIVSNYAGINGDTGTTAFGNKVFEKTGAGVLTVTGNNTYVGQTNISAGTLSINQDRALGAVPDVVTFNNVNIVGTLQATESFTLATNRGITLSNGTIDVVSTKTLSYGGQLAEGNSSGSGFKKSGGGTLAISSSSNIYSGATTINGGILSETSLVNGFGVLATAVTFTNGSNQIVLTGPDTAASLGLTVGMYIGSSSNLAARSTITAIALDGVTLTMSSTDTNVSASHNAIFGNPTSLGFSTDSNTSLVLDGGALGYAGSVAGGTNRQFSLGINGGGFDASGTTTAATMTISGNMTATGNAGSQVFTLSGSNKGDNTISGVIKNGTVTNTTSLTKSDVGKWIITSNNGVAGGYTGGTTIAGGTLFANNATSSTGTGNVTVQSSGTLGGSGTVTGAVTVNGGGSIQGGSGPTGTALTISGDLLLQSTSIINLSLSAGGTHSTLSRTAGTWTFDSTQRFDINDAGGVAPGFYDNIITGLASDPGTEGAWQFLDTHYVGTFAFDGSNIDLTLTAVPEPASLSFLGLGALALMKRRRRRATTAFRGADNVPRL